jgi:transposase InsO family protein
MAFGLTGAPGTFQGAMNCTLAPGLRKFVLVFFDDILVYSTSLDEHIDHLRHVFSWLRHDSWKLKLTKCSFAQRSVAYLGHVLSAAGVATDPSKVQAILDWPVPTSVRALRGFLGLAGYYRKFVRHFGIIAQPLTELLKKDAPFNWTPSQQTAFTALQAALSSAPVLALPDFGQPFHIDTDASGIGIGAVLHQGGHPIAFISKALCPRNRGLSAYEKEYLAILLAVEHWRHYLLQGEFYIHTDHQSLTHLNEQRLNTVWQQKVFTKLLGLNYRIVYKKGSENTVADALSRRDTEDLHLALSSSSPQWLSEVVASYTDSPQAQELLSKLATHPVGFSHYSLQNGVVRYKDRIWLGHSEQLQQQALHALHSSPVGGHSGIPVTYQKLRQYFFWPGMYAATTSFIRSCDVCQRAKPDRSRSPGFLQPLPIPSSTWEVISMDFVEGLPSSGSVNALLVVVDKLSKYAHFIPLRHPFTAASVARLFMDHIYRLHGMPLVIISDRDRIFTSAFWKSLFSLAGTSLNMSSAYHPQTDGQTERVNQCLETYLRCFAHTCPSKWPQWIPLAEYWYNTSPHSSLGRSPFEVLYGFPPRHFGVVPPAATPVSDLNAWLEDRTLMLSVVQQHLSRAQNRMKRQADKNRSERSFSVGDWVFLKMQPYVQSSLARRANQKLAFRFFGPYKILARVGAVAYKLELPSSSAIHPVFHVSQLKASHGTQSVTAVLPDDLAQFQVPHKILDRRWTSGSSPIEEVLVQWSQMPPSLATWENWEHIQQRFPRAPAWGHAGSKEGGIVSTSTPATSSSSSEDAKTPEKQTRPARERRPNTMLSGPEWAA